MTACQKSSCNATGTAASGRFNSTRLPCVDLLGHSQLGGKTLLFLVDGLYGSDNAITTVLRSRSFGTNWTPACWRRRTPSRSIRS